jgi:hypothetical protein
MHPQMKQIKGVKAYFELDVSNALGKVDPFFGFPSEQSFVKSSY